MAATTGGRESGMVLKRMTIRIGLVALIAAMPAVAGAGTGLRSIMRSWRDDARMLDGMLSGRTAPDRNAIGSALALYAEDAGSVAARVNGTSAGARNFRQRFVTFHADAKAALGDLNRSDAWRREVPQLLSQCRSCHEVFKQ